MNKKNTYETPAVTKRVSLELSQAILQGSVNASMTVETAGHSIQEEYDFSETPFNHTWE